MKKVLSFIAGAGMLAGIVSADVTPSGSYIVGDITTDISNITTAYNANVDASNLLEGSRLVAGSIPSAAIAAGAIVNADVNAAAAIALTKLAVAGLGDQVASVSSRTEYQGDLMITTISLTNVVMTATDGSDEGESLKVFDCDDGAFTILSVIANCSTVVSAGATNTYVLAFGTAAASDAADLTGTEVDIIPSTSIDTTGGTVLTNDFDAVLGAPANFDGTATAKDIYINFGIADANMDANVTNTITGTLTIISTKPIDN